MTSSYSRSRDASKSGHGSTLKTLLAATIGDLCTALVGESRQFEFILEESTKTTASTEHRIHERSSVEDVNASPQSMLDMINDAISVMKSVNRRVRDELLKSKQPKRESLKFVAEKATMTEKLWPGDGDEVNNYQTECDASVWKLQEELREREVEANSEFRAITSSINSVLTGDIKGEVGGGRNGDGGGGAKKDRRIRELELQLMRMEYRARNAEECCEHLKSELNKVIVDASNSRNVENTEY